jgi:ectoine hydroxylase-related dioxygenase (phytanoyl-CoA dioxygenase family)
LVARVTLTEEQQREFRERGLLITDVLFTPEELEPVRLECRRLYGESVGAQEVDAHKRLRPFLPGVHARSEIIAAFTRHAVFQELARTIVGPDADQAWNQACLKLPDSGETTTFPFHQDGKFALVDYRTGGFGCFLALAPLTLENGTLRFAVGAHGHMLSHQWNERDNWWECSVEGLEVVPGVLQPGQAVIYHPMTPHGSAPNRSPSPREAFLVAFGPPELRYADTGERFGDQRPLLRGGLPAW